MRKDPTGGAFLFLEIQGRFAGGLYNADFPTETLLTFEIGLSGMNDFTHKWISQSLRRPIPLTGNFVSLDDSLTEVYRDAWDWGYIRQIVFPALDVNSNNPMRLQLAMQITNLRQVPLKPGLGTSSHGDNRYWNSSLFFVKVGDVRYFVNKVNGLTVNLGPNIAGMSQGSPDLVMTTKESAAAGFRSWKQSGDPRQVEIQYLDYTLHQVGAMKFANVIIDHIHPAAPLNPSGDTEITMKIGQVTFNP